MQGDRLAFGVAAVGDYINAIACKVLKWLWQIVVLLTALNWLVWLL